MKKKLSRRRVLRGIVGGTAVTIGLPLLNCFLNDNGTAWASGAKMPVRFGTWAWGLGMNKAIFVPKKTGTGFDLPEEIASLANVRDHVNLLTNATYFRDSYQNLCHFTGWVVSRTGAAPKSTGFIPGETIDVTIANQIGRTTRFKTLNATATGDVRTSYSYENANSPNAPEFSPMTADASMPLVPASGAPVAYGFSSSTTTLGLLGRKSHGSSFMRSWRDGTER